jgi:hypothetical protein
MRKTPFEMVDSGDLLQKILERHVGTADCQTVSMILGISPDALPEATYCLLHSTDHVGESAVPKLCKDSLRELIDLLLAVGIETGLRLSGEGSNKWKN